MTANMEHRDNVIYLILEYMKKLQYDSPTQQAKEVGEAWKLLINGEIAASFVLHDDQKLQFLELTGILDIDKKYGRPKIRLWFYLDHSRTTPGFDICNITEPEVENWWVENSEKIADYMKEWKEHARVSTAQDFVKFLISLSGNVLSVLGISMDKMLDAGRVQYANSVKLPMNITPIKEDRISLIARYSHYAPPEHGPAQPGQKEFRTRSQSNPESREKRNGFIGDGSAGIRPSSDGNKSSAKQNDKVDSTQHTDSFCLGSYCGDGGAAGASGGLPPPPSCPGTGTSHIYVNSKKLTRGSDIYSFPDDIPGTSDVEDEADTATKGAEAYRSNHSSEAKTIEKTKSIDMSPVTYTHANHPSPPKCPPPPSHPSTLADNGSENGYSSESSSSEPLAQRSDIAQSQTFDSSCSQTLNDHVITRQHVRRDSESQVSSTDDSSQRSSGDSATVRWSGGSQDSCFSSGYATPPNGTAPPRPPERLCYGEDGTHFYVNETAQAINQPHPLSQNRHRKTQPFIIVSTNIHGNNNTVDQNFAKALLDLSHVCCKCGGGAPAPPVQTHPPPPPPTHPTMHTDAGASNNGKISRRNAWKPR